MKQKLIKIGNSTGIIIPYEIREEAGLKLGDNVAVNYAPNGQSIIISKKGGAQSTPSITPEFYDWLKKFNKKYKNALTELAKK